MVPVDSTFKQFQYLVAAACDLSVPNTTIIFMDALEKKKYKLSWYASILHLKGWYKLDKVSLTNQASLKDWFNMISALACKGKSPEPCLSLHMVNPVKVVKDGKRADLLAKQAKYKQAMDEKQPNKQRKKGDDKDNDSSNDPDDDKERDEEEIDPEDWNKINFQMSEIFDCYPLNKDYNTNIPVLINPAYPTKYIPITVAGCQEWAMCILDPNMPGVNIASPPQSLLPYRVQGAKKQKVEPKPANDKSSTLCRLLMDTISSNVSHSVAPHPAPTSDGVEYDPQAPEAPPILGYFEFLRLRKIDAVHETLLANGIISHRFFRRGSSLARSKVSDLGLNLGVVTALFDNVSQYERHLAHLRLAT
ncbi:hypothetical protein PTTG_27930 [Puccinia triticina 1-1 BBBD Race 1]|uniref:Uncharacterized protein n=1 Tax=Puccinia triticina (isolate 1-1 / race 1 (BBBD)) TaxID=630390 RepID=A0A180GFQ1_PUCT1|nr:hypothetical protein PTTG_27930 [Puccinia triticina 1-1 BBBD Race 1]